MLFDPCSDCGCPSAGVPCGICTLPKSNLTLTWTNGLLGTRSYPMLYDGVDQWSTGCVNQLTFRLRCAGGSLVFTAVYYYSGICPTGQAVACTGPGTSPTGLVLASYTCDPLFLDYRATPCPTLSSQGYTKFVVTL